MKRANLAITLIFVVFLGAFSVAGMLKNPEQISISERRKLAQAPQISFESIFSGQFTESYQKYLQDQAVLREDFRALKSFVERKFLLKRENNGVYIVDNILYDKFYGINLQYSERAATLTNNLSGLIDSNEIFLSIIPSKAQMLDRGIYPGSDQNLIADYFSRNVDAEYVSLMNLAEPGHENLYYKTDPHWTSDGAIEAYKILAAAMGYEPVTDYTYELVSDTYTGSDYGKAASGEIGDDSIYLAHNECLDDITVRRYETLDNFQESDSIYFRDRIASLDPYEVFIGGLAPITVIENDRAQADGELIIFKDSFAHSLAPFLAQHFKKVTLFDLRYVRKELIFENFDLTGKTVLFLYSTAVLNTDPQILN